MVVVPHTASRKQDVSSLIKLHIIKRFEFTSQTMKSGALVVPDDAPEGTALLLVKGAPNVIKHMARAGSVPENFDRVSILASMLRCAVLCRATLGLVASFSTLSCLHCEHECGGCHLSSQVHTWQFTLLGLSSSHLEQWLT